MRILTILARHGVEQYRGAEDDIQELFDRQLPAVERDVLVIDNALPAAFVEHRAGRTLLGGDNTVREFTAFDRAIGYAQRDLRAYDFVHFATSAFKALYTSYLDRFTPAVLAAAADRPACLGHIDCYNQAVTVESFTSQHWTRTCFFFLRPAEVLALGSMVSVADGQAFFSGDPSSPFRADAPLCATYQNYIVDWLTGRDIGQGVTWHSKLSLTADELASFEQKALCILNEQMLGIRLRAMGCPLVDVTWLATQLEGIALSGRRRSGSDVVFSTHWTQQLANRDRDRVTVHEAG